ncbi:MAG: hypothetical protein DWQ36_08735 [Acidobacteria bacterium]|nr:MAG: hypothetical protein DWQ30_04300 [Acidobacteriota bacterium]REK08729.1 MAG: hypothetical protein DWQ36_08735 [Acidobacteriota bacterium]
MLRSAGGLAPPGCCLALLAAVSVPWPGRAQTISLEPLEPQINTATEGGALRMAITLDDSGSAMTEDVVVRFFLSGEARHTADYVLRGAVEPQPGGVTALVNQASGEIRFDESLAGFVGTVFVVADVVDDELPEGEEELIMSIVVVSGAVLSGPSSAGYTFVDNDNPQNLPIVRFDLSETETFLTGPRAGVVEARIVLDRPALVGSSVQLTRLGSTTVEGSLTFVPGTTDQCEEQRDCAIVFQSTDPRDSLSRVLQLVQPANAVIGSPSVVRVHIPAVSAFDRCAYDAICFFFQALAGGGCEVGRSASRRQTPRAHSGTRQIPTDVLYALRDDLMATTPAGRFLTALYEDLSGPLIDAIFTDPRIPIRIRDQQTIWLTGLDALVRGEGSSETIAQPVLDDLLSLLDDIEANGDPTLRAILRRERARVRLEEFAGLDFDQAWELINERAEPQPCVTEDEALCLGDGRFRVEVEWEDFSGNVGFGRAAPLSEDTGTFWFFDQENVELIVKVLDGRDLNDHHWVFYGALSDVAYTMTVTDTLLGTVRSYGNEAGSFASRGDVEAFPEERAPSPPPQELLSAVGGGVAQGLRNLASGAVDRVTSTLRRWFGGSDDRVPSQVSERHARVGEHGGEKLHSLVFPAVSSAVTSAAGTCVTDQETLCLGDDRFRARVQWTDFAGQSGSGQAAPLTSDTGSFWFFEQANTELVVKVLDGTGLNDHYWVYFGALSNVEYTLTVTDTVTGAEAVYENPGGTFASRGDVTALPAGTAAGGLAFTVRR